MKVLHRIVSGFLLLLLCTLPAPSFAASNLLLLGDSLGAGHGVALELRWSRLLQLRLDQLYPHRWKVINASISGETTDGGLRRLPDLLNRYRPAITLLELGGNDGLRGFSLAVTRKNLAAMITDCRNAHSQVVLIGIRLPPNYGPQYTQAFADIYTQLARGFNVPLVPFLLAGVYDKAGMMQEDGIHPTAKAQPQLLDTVWKTLAPVVAEASQSRDADTAPKN